jgi:CRP-like cAMP-binding protein
MALEDDLRNLARNPTLAVLEPEALRRLALAATPRTLNVGDILFHRDEPSEAGFLLCSGSIALDPTGYNSAARIVYPPALIGDMALITPTRRPTTAIAHEPSKLLEIPRALFQRTLAEWPKSAERLRRLVTARLRGFVKDIDELREQMSDPPDGG